MVDALLGADHTHRAFLELFEENSLMQTKDLSPSKKSTQENHEESKQQKIDRERMCEKN
jgi:hypothetical protein